MIKIILAILLGLLTIVSFSLCLKYIENACKILQQKRRFKSQGKAFEYELSDCEYKEYKALSVMLGLASSIGICGIIIIVRSLI